MFGLFKSREPNIPEYKRAFLENNFLWLIRTFGTPLLEKRPITISKKDIPVLYDGTEKPVKETLKILCRQMDVDYDSVEMQFLGHTPKEIDSGIGKTYIAGKKEALGIYTGRAENGKFQIYVHESLFQKPVNLVATLTHELAHVRLLGEHFLVSRYHPQHELLTEMFCVYCGLGVFRTNSAFDFNNGFDGWSWKTSGYLREESWLYLLGLYALSRNEDEPAWITSLKVPLQKEFTLYYEWMKKQYTLQNLASRKWKNMPMEIDRPIPNLSGKWKKKSVYGETYSAEYANKEMFTDITLKDTEGELTGSGMDTEGPGIQNAPISIEGTVMGDAIRFDLHYDFADKLNDQGIVTRKADRDPYTVLYAGYYSHFLDACIGTWKILGYHPLKGEVLLGTGTFEMKRA